MMELSIVDAKQNVGKSRELKQVVGREPVGRPKPRKRIRRALKPVVIPLAVLYFLIDALFFAAIKPLATWLSKLRIFARVGSWVRSLGPYSTLAMFVIPFVALEPIKPVGLYLIASGRVIYGTLVISVGEVLKITIVERLFQVGRDKLMTIPAFARCYEFVMSWRAYLQTLAVWQAMLRWVHAIKQMGRRMLAFGRERLAHRKLAGSAAGVLSLRSPISPKAVQALVGPVLAMIDPRRCMTTESGGDRETIGVTPPVPTRPGKTLSFPGDCSLAERHACD